ncbi:hypothetical protein, partial [Escherichia coli]|uniref:hypothetical protein n=2 Tax=Escherichia coli TaxID=562 RepID=UPI00254619F1
TIVSVVTLVWGISPRQPSGKNIIRWLLKKEQMVVSAIASTPQTCHIYIFINSITLPFSSSCSVMYLIS